MAASGINVVSSHDCESVLFRENSDKGLLLWVLRNKIKNMLTSTSPEKDVFTY